MYFIFFSLIALIIFWRESAPHDVTKGTDNSKVPLLNKKKKVKSVTFFFCRMLWIEQLRLVRRSLCVNYIKCVNLSKSVNVSSLSCGSSTCRGSPWRSWNTSCSTPSATTSPWRTSRTSSSMRRRAWRRTLGTVRRSLREVSQSPQANTAHAHTGHFLTLAHVQTGCVCCAAREKIIHNVRWNLRCTSKRVTAHLLIYWLEASRAQRQPPVPKSRADEKCMTSLSKTSRPRFMRSGGGGYSRTPAPLSTHNRWTLIVSLPGVIVSA